jgi:hypothetical protein
MCVIPAADVTRPFRYHGRRVMETKERQNGGVRRRPRAVDRVRLLPVDAGLPRVARRALAPVRLRFRCAQATPDTTLRPSGPAWPRHA